MRKLLAIFITIFITGCSQNHPIDLGENKPDKNKHLETVKVEKGQLASQIKLPGQLKAYERVDIYPKVNGFVKDVFVDRGSIVHAGQTLMTLEAPEIEQDLQAATDKFLQAQEALNASRDRYFRLKTASKKVGAVSQLELVNAESKFQADSAFWQSEKASLNAVSAMKDYLIVKAPFDGVITERNIHPGSLTGPNFKMDSKPLLVLQQNSKLRLEVFVPEEYVEDLNAGDKKIAFTTGAIPGQTFEAKITRLSASLNDSYRSEAIEADVMNSKGLFMPGMYVEARLNISGNVAAYLVPSSAVITSTEKRYVVANDNGQAKFILVTVGVSENGKTEIFGKLNGTETVVKKPATELREGATI